MKMSNTDPTKNRGWTRVLLIRHPPCYSPIQPRPVQVTAVIGERNIYVKCKRHGCVFSGYLIMWDNKCGLHIGLQWQDHQQWLIIGRCTLRTATLTFSSICSMIAILQTWGTQLHSIFISLCPVGTSIQLTPLAEGLQRTDEPNFVYTMMFPWGRINCKQCCRTHIRSYEN